MFWAFSDRDDDFSTRKNFTGHFVGRCFLSEVVVGVTSRSLPQVCLFFGAYVQMSSPTGLSAQKTPTKSEIRSFEIFVWSLSDASFQAPVFYPSNCFNLRTVYSMFNINNIVDIFEKVQNFDEFRVL